MLSKKINPIKIYSHDYKWACQDTAKSWQQNCHIKLVSWWHPANGYSREIDYRSDLVVYENRKKKEAQRNDPCMEIQDYHHNFPIQIQYNI